jgi:hypothetical protein
MGLNKNKSNMYEWIDKTVNPLAGKCFHNCSYCYVENWKVRTKQHASKYSGEPRICENGMKQINGKNKLTFVISMNDLFTENVPDNVISEILQRCNQYDNTYLFQTKNPKRLFNYLQLTSDKSPFKQVTPHIKQGSIICTTIETNRFYPDVMGNCPNPEDRAFNFGLINGNMFKKFITIEPIMDFDLNEFLRIIEFAKPHQVNIGADSKGHNLPEPPKEKILELISELEKFTIVKQKSNLKRLLK